MRHRHGEEALLLFALMAMSACADPATRTAGPTTISANVQPGSTAPESEERSALTRVARLVAVAMDNEPARQQIKRDMRAALFREHKLELGPYLRSKDGRAVLTRIVEASGTSETEFFNTLNAIRPLEIYMPVASQREKWTGASEVLVVSQLEQSAPLVSFDSRGREIVLDRNTPPAEPTLSIVPVETRFDRPMNPATSRNARDENGAAIGTLEPLNLKVSKLIACGSECGGGGSGGGSSIDPGLYLEFSRIMDMKEPWNRGDPEIEVHIQGPEGADAPRYGADLSCSGEHAYDYRKVFNQDGAFWEGQVMLYSAQQTASYIQKFNEGFHVLFWEDDNEPCVLRLDSNSLVAALQSAASATGTVAVKVLPGATFPVVAGVFIGNFFANAGAWLLTNDDFLGAAVAQEKAGYYYPGNTHVIMDGLNFNGRATIVYR